MTATTGTESRSRRSTTACASVRRLPTAAASVMVRNSPMSAPAMKPLFLAERSTTPLGSSRVICASTSLSSRRTSSLMVLALAPALSKMSQAMPSSSRASFQCRHGPGATGLRSAENGPSSRLRGASVSQTLPMLHRLDEHGAALSAADALGGDALLDAEPFHGVDEVEHNAIAARADGMAEPDGAAVHIELVALDAPGSAIEVEHVAAERLVLPCRNTCEHLRGEGFVQFPQPDVGERKPLPAHDGA